MLTDNENCRWLPKYEEQHFPTPYLTVMDWGHDERDYAAGHSRPCAAPFAGKWSVMMSHIKGICERAAEYGVRP